MDTRNHPIAPTWIRGPELRKRWGNMPVTTFNERRKRGLIPEAEHPFGPKTPYWRLTTIETFEQQPKAA